VIPVLVRSRHGEPVLGTHVGSVAASVEHALHVLAFACPLCGQPVELQAVQHGFVATNLPRAELAEGEACAVRIEAQLDVEPAPLYRHLAALHGVRWSG